MNSALPNPGDTELTSAVLDQLQPPRAETRADYERQLEVLEMHASRHQNTSVEVLLSGENDESSLHVMVAVDRNREGQEAERTSASIDLMLQEGDSMVYFSNKPGPAEGLNRDETGRARIEEAVQKMAEGLPEDQRVWILETWAEAQSPEDTIFTTLAAEKLLDQDSVPFEALDMTTCYLRRDFEDGTHIASHWMRGNDVFNKEWPEGMAIVNLDVVDPQGLEYNYSRFISGTEKLEIQDPKHKIPREIADVPTELTVPGATVRGSAEFMQSMVAGLAAKAEAAKLGLDEVNDGKLQRLNGVLHDVATRLEAA
ncbi:MAG TPA: hypothetical protein VK674_01495 [Candidatus Limnocylindria bacterium]|nr:hypothetical protein [Candidatus Limnocylindria bacterium]